MRRVISAFVLAALQGCAEDGSADGTTTMVIDPDGWAIAADAEDPFVGQRPAEAMCDPAAVSQELFGGEPGLEVWTGLCDWVSVVQPLRTTVPMGAKITVRLWHFELTAPAPGQARLAVAMDGAPLWEKKIEVPSASALVRETWVLPATVQAGAPIVFHLDNHGANTYTLLEISAVW